MKKPLELIAIPGSKAGDIIKAFRANFDIVQDDMAWACGISQANLSAIENNRREVGPKLAVKIAAFLDVHPSILLYPNGYESLPEFKEVQRKKKKIG
ncbi:MAG: helix-turn-helix transcriptional regulator [Pseudomonadota bacterium]|nr:helix-turn-helix transcriptional regulator [Pseudomonadota bacterium]